MRFIFLLKMLLYLVELINHCSNKRIGSQIIESLRKKDLNYYVITAKDQDILLRSVTRSIGILIELQEKEEKVTPQ